MAVSNSISESQRGQLVAIEGDIEAVSVQLMLLPPSRKILILPALTATSTTNPSDAFDACEFVRNIHTAFTKRAELARSFLQSSTSTQPRLVFMNGGSIGARAACVARISKEVTNGSIADAETLLDVIIKNGVARLRDPPKRHKQEQTQQEDMLDMKAGAGDDSRHHSAPYILASGSLKTDAIQLANLAGVATLLSDGSYGISTSGKQQRSGSDPTMQNTWRMKTQTKNPPGTRDDLFTSSSSDEIVKTMLEVPYRPRRLFSDDDTFQLKRSTFGPRDSIYNRNGDDFEYDDEEGLKSPGGESIMSVPATPAVVFGEAQLVDMASDKIVKKSQSFDRYHPSTSRTPAVSGSTLLPAQLKHSSSAIYLRTKVESQGPLKEEDYSAFPRRNFTKASETTIRRSPPQSGSLRSNSLSTAPRARVYVDRATDAWEVQDLPSGPFTPVFPVTEDLIIHLVGDQLNEVLEALVLSYRNGKYGTASSMEAKSNSEPHSPNSESSFEPIADPVDKKATDRPTSYHTVKTENAEYDPYAAHNKWPQIFKRHLSLKQKSTEDTNFDFNLSTPVQTPPVTRRTSKKSKATLERFIELAPVNSRNAISVQNSLRQLLSVHFPPGEEKYCQHYYPVHPEADRLWKPVFRNDENAAIGNKGRTVDQIIAVGREHGVKKDFFLQISGQIEKLGMKRDGVNRSGKLDIRYLIANAMQTYSTLPLIVQSTFNPLSDPKTLASLLVPEIEAFLASNPSTRFLILQYQAPNLPVIFALRRIIGSDLLKVAGILDSLASDPPPLRSPPLNSSPKPLRHQRRTSVQRSRTDSLIDVGSAGATDQELTPNFARANYLLPSTDTDGEITTFLSGIWKLLMEKSAFYTPEPEIKPIMIIERPPMPPTPASPTFNLPLSPALSGFPSSYSGAPSKISRLTGNRGAGNAYENRQRSLSRGSARSAGTGAMSRASPPETANGGGPPVSIYTQSEGKSRKSLERERERGVDEELTKTNSSPGSKDAGTAGGAEVDEKDWETFYINEEDSDDDEFDRMIMGRQMARIVPERRGVAGEPVPLRNKKKALKWLGLA